MAEEHICDDAGASMPKSKRKKLVAGRHRKDDNFRCGSCRATFATICVLHAHCEKHSVGGSYFFDHFTRTAFAKYDTACVVTQTDFEYLLDESSISTLSPSISSIRNCGVNQTVDSSSSGKSSFLQKTRKAGELAIKKEPKHGTNFVDMIQSGKDSEQLTDDDDVERSEPRECVDETEQYGDANLDLISDSTSKMEVDQDLKSSSFTIRRSTRQRKRKQFIDGSFVYEGDNISTDRKLIQNGNDNGCLVKKQIPEGGNNAAGASMEGLDLAHIGNETGIRANSGKDTNITRLGNSEIINMEYSEVVSPTEDQGYPCKALSAVGEKIISSAAKKRSGAIKSSKGTNTSAGLNSKSRHKKRDPIKAEYCDDDDDDVDSANANMDKASQPKQSPKQKKLSKGADDAGQSRQRECPTCGKVGTGGMLTYHKYLHMEKKSFSCDKCGALFQQPQSLRIHLRQHDDDKRYKCPECPAAFHRKPYLTTHLLKHKGENPFQCESCGKSYRDPNHLKRHIKHVHDKVRNFSCDICQEKFFRSDHLSNHRLRHFEPDKKCPHCSKLFKHPNDLLRHLQIHTGEKNWYCNICGHGFVSVTPYYAHMEKKHNVPKKEAKLLKDKLREEYKKIKQEKAQKDSEQLQDPFETKSVPSVIAENREGTDGFGTMDEAQSDTSSMFILRDAMEGHDYASSVELPASQTDINTSTDTQQRDFIVDQDGFINYTISTTNTGFSSSLTTDQGPDSAGDLMLGYGRHVINQGLKAELSQQSTDFSSHTQTKASASSRQAIYLQESKTFRKKKESSGQKFPQRLIQVRNEKGKVIALSGTPIVKQKYVRCEIPDMKQLVRIQSGKLRVVQMTGLDKAEDTVTPASNLVRISDSNEYVLVRPKRGLTDLDGAEHEMLSEESSDDIGTEKQLNVLEDRIYQLRKETFYTDTLRNKETLIKVVNANDSDQGELQQSDAGNTEMFSEVNKCSQTIAGEQVVVLGGVNVDDAATFSDVNMCTQTVSSEGLAGDSGVGGYDIMEETGELCEVQYASVGDAGREEIVTGSSEIDDIVVGDKSGGFSVSDGSDHVLVGNEAAVEIIAQWNDGSIGGMTDTVMIVDGDHCASEVIIDNK